MKKIMVCALLFAVCVSFSSFAAKPDTSAANPIHYQGYKMGKIEIGIFKRADADSVEMQILKKIKTTFNSDKDFIPTKFGCYYYIGVEDYTVSYKDGRKEIFKNATLKISKQPAGPSLSATLYGNAIKEVTEQAMKDMITFIKTYH